MKIAFVIHRDDTIQLLDSSTLVTDKSLAFTSVVDDHHPHHFAD
jgi:hypothetical protein